MATNRKILWSDLTLYGVDGFECDTTTNPTLFGEGLAEYRRTNSIDGLWFADPADWDDNDQYDGVDVCDYGPSVEEIDWTGFEAWVKRDYGQAPTDRQRIDDYARELGMDICPRPDGKTVDYDHEDAPESEDAITVYYDSEGWINNCDHQHYQTRLVSGQYADGAEIVEEMLSGLADEAEKNREATESA